MRRMKLIGKLRNMRRQAARVSEQFSDTVLDDKEAQAVMWEMHFEDKLPGEVTCQDCFDFEVEVCAGGGDPSTCPHVNGGGIVYASSNIITPEMTQ